MPPSQARATESPARHDLMLRVVIPTLNGLILAALLGVVNKLDTLSDTIASTRADVAVTNTKLDNATGIANGAAVELPRVNQEMTRLQEHDVEHERRIQALEHAASVQPQQLQQRWSR